MMSETKPTWQQIFRQNFVRWDLLADFLQFNDQQREFILKKSRFPLNLPIRLAQKIEKKTLDDPILRQFLPTVEENKLTVGFGKDPVGDCSARKTSRLLHKYNGRMLLVCTSACAMHCRYCFRQKFDYSVGEKSFVEELQLIANDPTIHEVILSGGDPLSLPDRTLKNLLDDIARINHVKRIRFHSRFPVGIPERINEPFLEMLQTTPQQIWFVLHSNHVRELDPDVLASMKALQKIGVTVINQSVLLRGVNDSLEALKHLCETLADNGIMPYYLHQLDRVQGAAHFEVPETEGIRLVQELSGQLSGYAVPKYVREIAGAPGKSLLS